jgi:hypothetical protein
MSYDVFHRLVLHSLYNAEYIPSIPSFFRAFVKRGCWKFSKAFCTSPEMTIRFLSGFQFIFYITYF